MAQFEQQQPLLFGVHLTHPQKCDALKFRSLNISESHDIVADTLSMSSLGPDHRT